MSDPDGAVNQWDPLGPDSAIPIEVTNAYNRTIERSPLRDVEHAYELHKHVIQLAGRELRRTVLRRGVRVKDGFTHYISFEIGAAYPLEQRAARRWVARDLISGRLLSVDIVPVNSYIVAGRVWLTSPIGVGETFEVEISSSIPFTELDGFGCIGVNLRGFDEGIARVEVEISFVDVPDNLRAYTGTQGSLTFCRAQPQASIPKAAFKGAFRFELMQPAEQSLLFGWSRREPEAATTEASQRSEAQVIVLTALELEFIAVRSLLENVKSVKHPKGTLYDVGGMVGFDGVRHEVALVQIGSGNVRTGVEAERAISFFRPTYIFFVGVAGGLKDVDIGDVVVASKIYGYETGRAESEFKPREEIGQSSYRMTQVAKRVAREGTWKSSLSSERNPRALIAPIAAGEKVVADSKSGVYQFLRHNFSDAVAVEMEAIGVVTAAHANDLSQVCVIRGISDLIDDKSAGDAAGLQVIAAKHAAAFLFEMLKHTHDTGEPLLVD